MVDIVTRLGKGSPLTNAEVDANFTNLAEVSGVTGEPMGHEDRTTSTISFNASTRTFTIAPVASSFTVWCKGKKVVVSSAQTVTIPNTTGMYSIYYDANGVLSAKSGYFTFSLEAPTAYIYWNATAGTCPYFGDERHGVVLDWQTHEYLHRTRGAALASGFAASGYVLGGNGSSNSHAQITLEGGTFFDEDMKIVVTATNTPTAGTWEQDLLSPARIPVLYLSGTGWVIDAPSDYPLKQGASRPQYNAYSGGVWSTADVANNKYATSWILATNNLTYPVIAIIGQAESDLQSAAEAVDFTELQLPGFPSVEFRPLYKLIFQCADSCTNAVHASLVSITDIRSIAAAGTAASIVSDHGNLTGLSDDDHPQYIHVDTLRTVSDAVKASFLPSQTSNAGKFLQTDGTATSWQALTSGNVTTALGFTPYNATNPSGYISGITSGMVTTALGFTPYNATNPSGYVTAAGARGAISVTGAGSYDSATGVINIVGGVTSFNTRTGAITLSSTDVTDALGYVPYRDSNPSNYLTSINSTMVTTALGYTPYNSSNPNGYISTISSSMVTSALGFTPYDNSNPSGYVTSSSLSGYLTSASAVSTYLPLGGGTMTGPLVIDRSSGGAEPYIGLTIKHTSSSAGIKFQSSARTYEIQSGSDGTFLVYDRTAEAYRFTISSSGTLYQGNSANAILHAGNKDNYTYPPASHTHSYLPLSGGTMTGTLALHSAGTSGFYNGTGDGADYTTHNFRLSGWNGMGFYNPTSGGAYPNAVSGYVDFRNGIIDMKGGFKVNGSVVIHAGNYSSYALPLSGGTLTGNLSGTTIKATTGFYHGSLGYWKSRDNNGGANFVVEYSSSSTLADANIVWQLDTTGNAYKGNGTSTPYIHTGNKDSYTYPPASHTHSYLPLSGGTMTGQITMVSGTPWQVLAPGSGTYNKHVQYISGTEYTLEAAFATDSLSGSKLPITFTWRGGYGSTGGLQLTGGASGTLGGNAILHAGNYTSYRPPILAPINTTATGVSNWNPGSLTYQAWGQYFTNSNISADSGDLTLWLRPSQYSGGGTELNMYIDGDFYSGINQRVLNASNYNSYAPTLTGGNASGTWPISITGSALVATSAVRLQYNDGPRNLSDRLPNSFTRTVNFDFVGAGTGNGTGNYAGVMTYSPWTGTTASTGDSSYQLAFANASGVNASGQPRLSIRNGIDSTWNSWYILLHSGNYTDYAAPASHSHNYIPINPDGDGNAWTYADENPTINGVSIGGGQRFGADGSSYEGFLQAKIVNAYNGFVNSANGYYVGNYDFGANSNTYNTTRVIDGSGNVTGASVTSGGNNGFANDVYYSGVRNPIWKFGNASTYGISYFQGSAGIGGADTVGIHFGTTSASTSHFAVTPTAAYQNGNVILHAGNYSTYTFPKGGSWMMGLDSYGYTREHGMSMTGGSEFVVLSKNGQGYTLVDGSYLAGEGGGFFSSSNSSGGTLLGFNSDTTSSLNFNTTTVKLSGNQILHAGNYTSYSVAAYNTQELSGEISASVGSDGWYTIATHGGSRGYAEFWVYDNDSSRHNFVHLGVVFSFGYGGITVLSSGRHGTSTIRHARLLYNTSNQTYGGAKLQIYCENAAWTIICRMGNDNKFSGWSEWSIITPVLENTPSGWAELNRVEAINDQGVIGGTRLRIGSTDATVSGNQILHAGNYTNYSPGSGSSWTFGEVYSNGWFRNNNINQGLYNQNTGCHFYSNSGGSWGITGSGGNVELQFRATHQSTIRGYVYGDTSNNFGLLHNGGGWAVQVSPGGGGTLHGTWNGGNIRANRANGNFYIDDNYGYGIVGVYASTRYQGVFAMGDSYKLPADGTTTGSLYGMAWSHPNAGGAAGNLTDHGLLIINNGVFKCAISNSIVASGNVTAYSDERLKTNWRDMPENYVARLAQVKVGIYDRTDQEDVTQVGVSAQSFQKLLPQSIMTAKDEMQTLSVNYGGAALASAVELAKDNVELRARIERLESLINKLIGD